MQSVETKMLERMQDMMAAMSASVPDIGRNNQSASKTEKGESFQDLMNKAQVKKDAPAADKPVENKEQPDKAQAAEKPAGKVNTDGDEPGQMKVTVEVDQLSGPMLAALVTGAAQILGITEDGKFIYQQLEGAETIPVQSGSRPEGYLTINADGDRVMVSMTEIEAMLDKITEQKDNGEFPVIPENKLDSLLRTIDEMSAKDGSPVKGMVDVMKSAVRMDEDNFPEVDEERLEIGVETPLFRDLEGTPEKVGENFQLDTEQPDMDAQLANTIRQAAEAGLKQIQIKLSPENLGNLTIQLTQSGDGALHVVLHATSAKAASLLTQHLDSLNLALQGLNQNQVHIEVQRHEDAQQAQQQLNQQADPDGHNQQQHQQRQREEHTRSDDFLQQLRLGLFQPGEAI